MISFAKIYIIISQVVTVIHFVYQIYVAFRDKANTEKKNGLPIEKTQY